MYRFFCLLIMVTLSYGQYRPLTYNFSDLPQSLMQNPATAINFDKHLGIPFLSGFSSEITSSSLTLNDVFRTDTSSTINERIATQIRSLTPKDYLSVNTQLEILSFGWRPKWKNQNYYSGGLYFEFDFIGYFPKDIADLVYFGNADAIGRLYDLGQISIKASATTVYHFGLQHRLNSRESIGARLKMYSSAANAMSINNSGFFTTVDTPNGTEFYSHELRGVSVSAQASGLSDFDALKKRALLSKNLGLGVDFGYNRRINKQWDVSMSVQDLGFIYHSDDVFSFELDGDYLLSDSNSSISGIEDDLFDINDIKEELGLQFEEYELNAHSYFSIRPTKLHADLSYSYGYALDDSCSCKMEGRSYVNTAGLYLYSVYRPRGFQGVASAYFQRRWNSYLHTRFSYSYTGREFFNLGGLISLQFNSINFYLSSNNWLSFLNLAKTNQASFQLGLQLIFPSK